MGVVVQGITSADPGKEEMYYHTSSMYLVIAVPAHDGKLSHGLLFEPVFGGICPDGGGWRQQFGEDGRTYYPGFEQSLKKTAGSRWCDHRSFLPTSRIFYFLVGMYWGTRISGAELRITWSCGKAKGITG